MARTTFRLDGDLLAEAKALAARQHRTLNSLMEDALRIVIAEAAGQPETEPFTLHVHGGPAYGVRADVSIDSNAALADEMDKGAPVEERR
jgi:hypothetical protein